MSGIRIFELCEPLVAGGSARARLMNWRGGTYAPSAFATVIVHDFVGESGMPGDRGYCYLSDDSQRWEVLGSLAPVSTRERNEEDDERGSVGRRPMFPAFGSAAADDWSSSTFM